MRNPFGYPWRNLKGSKTMNRMHINASKWAAACKGLAQSSIGRAVGWMLFSFVFAVASAHATVPLFSVGPSVNGSPTSNSVAFDAQLNQPGVVYRFVVAAGSAVPTSTEVQALTSYRGVTAIGGIGVSTGGGPHTAFTYALGVSGLAPSTAYTAYFVASDYVDLQATPSAVDFTTAPPDITPPVFTVSPFVSGGPTANSADFSLTLNETGYYYLIAVPAAASAPNSAQIKAGATSGTAYAGVTPKLGQYSNVTGGVAASFSLIALLESSTAYKVYVTGEDGAGNLVVTPVSLDVTTTAAPPDITPPAFTAGPFINSGPTHNSAGISLTMNESGRYYLIAVPAAATAPASAQVKAGATTGAVYAGVTPKMGQYNNVVGGIITNFSLMAFLDSSTAYKVYVIGEDAAGNLLTTPAVVDVTTTVAPADTTPPVLTAGPTVVSGSTHNLAVYRATYGEAGHVYSIVVPAGSAAPTSVEVRSANTMHMLNYGAVTVLSIYDSNMLGNTPVTFFASLRSPSTAYTAYFVAEDAAGNLQAAPSSLDITSTAAPDVTPPTFTNGPTISSGPTYSSASFSITMSEAGHFYYLVVPATATTPTAAQVKAGVNYGAVTLLSHFDSTLLAGAATTLPVSFPSASTAYKVYMISEDTAGNLQAVATSLDITTATASVVTPTTEPTPPPPPSIPAFFVPTSTGVTAAPSIVNMSGGSGPAFTPSLVSALSTALGMPLQFAEQNASGTVVLNGFNGGTLAFVPSVFQTGDARANGIYPMGNGQYQVVRDGQSLVIVPAVVHQEQLMALLPGVVASVGDNGVINASFGGLTYVVQPSVTVQLGVGTGSAGLVIGSDGFVHFTDAAGNSQVLYPAFAQPVVVRNILQGLDPTAALSIQLDGTAAVVLNGQSYTLVPDITLAATPADRVGQSWWQEGPLRYGVATSSPLGMSQGFTVRP
jgi:hypothetical protein